MANLFDIRFLILSSGLGDKLKCFVCHNYLSYFPISVCSNEESLCGRCEIPDAVISFQDEAFESICQFMKFPCRWASNGCPDEAIPVDIPQHEENCLYRDVSCIIDDPKCDWKESLPTLFEHCRNQHSDIILKDRKFTIDLTQSEEIKHLVEHNRRFFIFRTIFDPPTSKLQYSISENQYETKTFSYHVCIEMKNSVNLSIVTNTSSFKERIYNDCSLESIRNNENFISGEILFGNIPKSQENQTSQEQLNMNRLALLQCATCREYATPPIFSCWNDLQTFCLKCWGRHIHNCLRCLRSSFNETRDTALDDMSAQTIYPCKYQNRGCKKTQLGKKVLDQFCEYAHEICPFSIMKSCDWSGLRKDVKDHILSHHRDLESAFGEILELDLNSQNVIYKIIPFHDELFILCYGPPEDQPLGNYDFIVYKVGPSTDVFRFEIDMIHPWDPKRRLTARQVCLYWTEEAVIDASIRTFHSVCFHKSQLSSFVVGNGNTIDEDEIVSVYSIRDSDEENSSSGSEDRNYRMFSINDNEGHFNVGDVKEKIVKFKVYLYK